MIQKTQKKSEEVSYGLSDVSPKDKPWDIHGRERDAVRESYFIEGNISYAERMLNCSQLLEFAVTFSEKQVVELKLKSTKFCRVRYCPVCQWRRSLKWRARFFEALPRVFEENPEVNFLFLTLTLKNCVLEELRETVGQMNRSWNKLVKRKQFPALGWVKSLEVTKAEDSKVHPHFHSLLMVPSRYFVARSYLSQRAWGKLWSESLKVDYNTRVHVEKVKPKMGEDERTGLMNAVCETLKYSVKSSDLVDDSGWLVKLTEQMYKIRAVSVGGALKPYLSDVGNEDDKEDLIYIEPELESEGRESGRCYFSWNYPTKRYISL